ncbi:hypothetical protein BDR26DRAFT_855496 [Obelidium mucronatum]|nr:hypothetical protein BDR26DRAFT_855496 [Obelidium mucronatum]
MQDQIRAWREADPTLTIKQVHERLLEGGEDVSASKVKKLFAKVSHQLKEAEQEGNSNKQVVQEVQQESPVEDADADALWSKAIELQKEKKSSLALECGTQAFLRYPDQLPSIAFEDSLHSQTKRAHHVSLFQSVQRITMAFEEKKINSEDTHRSFVIMAGLCLRNKDVESSSKMGQAACESLEGLKRSSPSLSLPTSRFAEVYSFAGALLVEACFYGDSVKALDKSIELNPNCIRTRQLRCVARFKATKFAGIVDDAMFLKAHAETHGPSKYLVAPYLVAALSSFMAGKVVEGNEWLELGKLYENQFQYRGPDARIYDMAVQMQKVFLGAAAKNQ